jgi:hypothetical protein
VPALRQKSPASFQLNRASARLPEMRCNGRPLAYPLRATPHRATLLACTCLSAAGVSGWPPS